MEQYEIKKPENMNYNEFKEHIAAYLTREQLKKHFKGVAS